MAEDSYKLLKSYCGSSSDLPAILLANNGFELLKPPDTIQCVECKKKFSSWKETENVYNILLRHANLSPRCHYGKISRSTSDSYDSAYGSMGEKQDTIDTRLHVSQNHSGLPNTETNNEISRAAVSSSFTPSSNSPRDKPKSRFLPTQQDSRLPVPVVFSSDGTYKVATPGWSPELQNSINPVAKISQYQEESARLISYRNWPIDAPIDPISLSKAGLYYTGDGDKVKCPFCLGAMYNWEKDDDPFEEHQRHYPECTFVEHKKHIVGDVQTNSIQQRLPVGSQTELEDSSSTVREMRSKQQAQRSTKFEELQVVNIVKDMGYSLKMLKKAATKIPNYSLHSFTTSDLLDAVFQLDEEGYNSDDEEELEGAVGMTTELQGAVGVVTEPQGGVAIAAKNAGRDTSLERMRVREDDQLQPPLASRLETISLSKVGGAVSKVGDSSREVPQGASSTTSSTNISRSAEFAGKHGNASRSDTTNEQTNQSVNQSVSQSNNESQGASQQKETTSRQSDNRKTDEKKPEETSTVSGDNNDSDSQGSAESPRSRQDKPVIKKRIAVSKNPKYKKLAEEHNKLVKNKICNVCESDYVSVLFLPCRHLICCEPCANNEKHCPQCKKLIVGTVKIYLS